MQEPYFFIIFHNLSRAGRVTRCAGSQSNMGSCLYLYIIARIFVYVWSKPPLSYSIHPSELVENGSSDPTTDRLENKESEVITLQELLEVVNEKLS